MFKPYNRTFLKNAATLALALILVSAVQAKKIKPPPEPPEPPAPALEYSMTILPSISGASGWTPMAVNNHGDIVGLADGLDGGQRAVLYTRFGEVMLLEDLITLPAEVTQIQVAEDISDDGWIAGTVIVHDEDGQYRMRRFRGQADLEGEPSTTVFEVLQAPAGYTWSYGQAINNFGDVAVNAENDGCSELAGFVCTVEDVWVQIPGAIQARDINDAGEVASWIFVDGQPPRLPILAASGRSERSRRVESWGVELRICDQRVRAGCG